MKSNATVRRETPAHRGPRTENRQKILDVSLDLFAARGFDGISIRDISDAASVHGATIYHYFGDKQALYQLTVRAAVEQQLIEHIAVLESPGAAPERLHRFLSNLVRSMMDADAKRQLIERMYSEPDDRAAPFEKGPLQARFQEGVMSIIREIAPDAADMAWVEVSGIVNGIPHGMMRSRTVHERAGGVLPPFDIEEQVNLITELVIAAFKVVAERNRRAG